MQKYLIYIIPAAIVLIVFIAGFAYSRKAAAKYAPSANVSGRDDKPRHSGVYEAPGVNQQSGHPLGAVQSVIHGRIQFLLFGIMLICVALFGLWALYFTGKLDEFSKTPLHKLAFTVLMIGAVIWGLQLISYITYRVTLRRTGFEISSIFGTNAYAYNDVEFYLSHTIEHKHKSDGYRPVIMKTQTFNFIWECQVLFRDGRKPIILKSSRYAWLKNKMQRAIDTLY